MRRLKITGGPNPRDVRIIDTETGVDLTSVILGFTIEGNPNGLLKARLTTFVELDLEAGDDGDVTPAAHVALAANLATTITNGEVTVAVGAD
jgi:hypothetical protein